MSCNPVNVVQLLKDEFGSHSSSPINESERALARKLSDIIKSGVLNNMDVIEDCELVFENESDEDFDPEKCSEEIADSCVDDFESNSEETVGGESSSPWQLTPIPGPSNKRDDVPFSKRKMAVDFWRNETKKPRSFESVKRRHRFVSNKRQLEYWATQVDKNGPYHEKMKRVSTAVRLKVKQARDDKKPIHDQDIRRWALLESKKENLTFKASNTWLKKFKGIIKIRSRKVTKFVSKVSSAQSENLTNLAQQFVDSVRNEFKQFSPEEIYNTDQSGFNLEMHSRRTLAYIGDKHVECIAQSVAATTHSYTIMPTITAAGKLLSPLTIVLKEPEGKFGPTVEHGLYKARNIYLIPAKSSMMGKREIHNWFENVFLPNIGQRALLLVDSLNSYKSVQEKLPKEKELVFKTIPAHTTGQVQPLDVFFFRQWKNFSRKISEYVLLENIDFPLRKRNNIIKLQSLVHNQFSAPQFLNFRKYAWFKSGYFEGESPEFVNPVDYCFMSDIDWCSKCSNVSLLKCGWCEKALCIHHALVELHFHDE